jgi:hypothetical protein
VRRIVTRQENSTASMEFPVGEMKKAGAEVQGMGGAILLVGILLLVASLGKFVTGIATLLKRNWGRVGLIGLAALEAVLIVVLLATGGAGAAIVISLALNVALAASLATGKVKAAMV